MHDKLIVTNISVLEDVSKKMGKEIQPASLHITGDSSLLPEEDINSHELTNNSTHENSHWINEEPEVMRGHSLECINRSIINVPLQCKTAQRDIFSCTNN